MKTKMNWVNSENNVHQEQEVEIRAQLKPGQKEMLVKRLEESKGSKTTEHIKDIYLCPKRVTSFDEIEMNEVGSYSLRVRQSTSEAGKICTINTKTITRFGDHNAWEEHEVEVSSAEEAMAIFQAIGFKPFFTLEKERTSFNLITMKVAVEEIAGFGQFVEVEIITTKTASDKAKIKIQEFLKSVGIEDSQVVPKSVTNILMRKKAKF